MSPVNFGEMSKYMGPLTSGGMMSEQQRMAVGESVVNQNKGLEDILTQQQTRDINRQKLPGELEKQGLDIQHRRGEVAAQGTAAEDRLEKLDKQRVTDFLGAVLTHQASDDPLENSFALQDLAKKYKLDGNDPRIRGIMMGATDKRGIAAMQRALIESDPKWQADRKKAEEEKAKSDAEIAGRTRVAGIQAAASMYGSDQRAATAMAKQAAQAKLASIEQELVKLVTVINDPNSSGQDKQIANAKARQLLAAKQSIILAVTQEKYGQLQNILNPGGGSPTPGASPQNVFPEVAPAAEPKPPQAPVGPPPQAIQLLRSNPAMAAAFDAKYGPGSAAKVLQGQ